MKLSPQKLEGWGYRIRWQLRNFNRFWLIHPCDRQTDRQTLSSLNRCFMGRGLIILHRSDDMMHRLRVCYMPVHWLTNRH